MKKGKTVTIPILVTVVYLVSCALLLFFTGNIRITLIAVAFSPVLMIWIVIRISKKTSLTPTDFYEEYDDMLDWGIGDYKKTWKKMIN